MNWPANPKVSEPSEIAPSPTGSDRRTGWRVLLSLARVFGAIALLAVASFCVFGFLASFEPPTWVEFQAGYAALGCGCLMGVAALLGLGAPRTLPVVALLGAAMFSVLGFMVSARGLGLRWELSYGALACACAAGAIAALWRRIGRRSVAVRLAVYLVFFVIFGAFSSKFFIYCLVPLLNRLAHLFR